MSDTLRQQLQQAEAAISANNFFAARSILLPLAQANPDNADVWWALARAQTDTATQRDMLKRVIQLNPYKSDAVAMLTGLDAPRATAGFDQIAPAVPVMSSAPMQTPNVSVSSNNMSGSMNNMPRATPLATSYTPTPTARSNRGRYILLGVAGTLVLGCLICVGIVASIVNNPSFQAAISMPARIPANTVDKGAIMVGSDVTDNISVLDHYSYTYKASKGEQVAFTVTRTGSPSNTSVLIGIYDTSGKRLNATDITDAATNKPLTLTQTFAADGVYTIVIGGLSSSTNYTLSVTSNAAR